MSWNNLGAGLVVITVTASRITPPPYSPQPFSLVVQGSFTGGLESEYNPGWSRATTTSCSLPVAHITTAPPVLSNNRAPTFSFATATDPAAAGFQCKLSGTGGSTVATTTEPLQDWTACSVLPSGGTKTFNFGSGLTPVLHTYLFQVRATSASPLSCSQNDVMSAVLSCLLCITAQCSVICTCMDSAVHSKTLGRRCATQGA